MADGKDAGQNVTETKVKDAAGQLGTGLRMAEPSDDNEIENKAVAEKIRRAKEMKAQSQLASNTASKTD